MVHTCVVFQCRNRSSDPIKRSFHSFPAIRTREGQQTEDISRRRRETWIARVDRKNFTPTPYSKVCSDHFVKGKPADLYDPSNPDWAPSLNLKGKSSEPNQKDDMKRYTRRKERKAKAEANSVAQSLLELSKVAVTGQNDDMQEDDINVGAGKICNFIASGSLEGKNVQVPKHDKECDIELFAKTKQECQRLTTENLELRDKLEETKISIDSFKDNDKKVNYYTGLPKFVTLLTIFQFLEPFIPEGVSLTKFQKLLLVLMKLRLDLPLQDLAYRFGVSQSTASRTFLSVIHVMYIKMKGLIQWPEREELRLTMPMEFRKYFGLKVVVIIDCFEIFIERPSGLLARAKTWSSYKHHNTVKFLIGVTPQGSVSFISDAWGGRASDKCITENCGMLNKLVPGDLVLADRGFDIAENVGVMCAEVKIPSFTKGKSQLPALEIEKSRNIAHLRIHVERVIGLIRNKYTVLQGTIPIDYLLSAPDDVPVIDKIVTVCCSLANMCGSVVPFS